MTIIFQSEDMAWEPAERAALTPHAVGATTVPRVGDHVILRDGFRGRVAKITWTYWEEGLHHVAIDLDPSPPVTDSDPLS